MRIASSIEVERDLALQWHMHADYERMIEAGVPLPAGRTKRDRQAIASIASGIISSARTRPGRWMSYSRSESWYPGQEMYYGDAFGYSTVVGAIERLSDGPLIEGHIKARPGDHLRRDVNGLTLQSRILPAAGASKITLPKMGKELAQSIRLRRRDDKRLVAYTETENIGRMRGMLTKLNAHYAEADIEFRGGRRDGEIVFHVSKRGHEYGVDLSNRACHRVFSDVWTLGGRYYGAAWQALGKDARQQIVINGEAVFEADYATLHPRMLYRAAGLRLDGDAYDIPGYRDQREACKRGLNILINANSRSDAVHALTEHVSGGYFEADDMIEAIREKHRGIAHYFHSDAGIRLQRIDSSICTGILNELTVKKGITVLSVHDSFIVQNSYKEMIVDAMERHYNDHIDGVSRILDSCVKSKESVQSPLHKGSILPSALPASRRGDSANAESLRNRPKDREPVRQAVDLEGNADTTPSHSVVGVKTARSNRRFDRLRRKPEGANPARGGTFKASSLVASLENTPDVANERVFVIATSPNTGEGPDRAVWASSDDCRRSGSPFVDTVGATAKDDEVGKERKKVAWRPRKTTVLELIRAEETRRDVLRHRRRDAAAARSH
ncbi:hypothetical protein N2601_08690 [Rhizobium sp. CB3060]|uniref:hypothetical protein n=1 Tax=Rhizobium sp. CB3060 TaxID=3138255 RepID=UPI0021A26B85|nr:hypothetical protein [Rhizobium tropici]UWU23006.1 hypothetical protein N2601_08690 [Rhizobium tropici]